MPSSNPAVPRSCSTRRRRSPPRPGPDRRPELVINSFEIPPFLLPIYQACGAKYGIPWAVLAAINEIESASNQPERLQRRRGRLDAVPPSSWETYRLDVYGDGRKDPYNPVDAICAAAHYLKVAGGQKDLYGAILAYNRRLVRAGGPRLRPRLRPHPLPTWAGYADRPHRGRPLRSPQARYWTSSLPARR